MQNNYHGYETSAESGTPVELYDIAFTGGVWTFTTDTEDVTFDGKVYKSVPIKRGEIEDTGDTTKANLEIRTGRNTSLGDVFKVTPPSEPVTVTIRQYHAELGFIAPDLMTVVVWKGRITNVAWENDEIVLIGESIFSSLMRIGVTRKFSRSCSHALYGKNCGVRKEEFSVTEVARSVVGTVITFKSGKPDNWFAGGYVQYKNSETGVLERRHVIESTGSTITLSIPPLGLVSGKTEVTAFAGCDHAHTTCKTKFNNIINYGGQPFIPIQNPFQYSNIY